MQNLKGDLTLLRSAIDGVQVALYKTESGPLRDIVQGVTKWVTANKDLIAIKFGEWMKNLKRYAVIFGDAFKSTIEGIKEGISVFSSGEDSAKQWRALLPELAKNLGQIAAIAVSATAAFAALAAGMVLVASTLVSGLRGAWAGITKILGSVIHSYMDFWADLKAIFNAEGMGLARKAYEIGKHIIVGLLKGIKAAADMPVKAIKEIGGRLLTGVKRALGIASESKKAKALGVFTSSGFAAGIKTGTSAVQQAIDDMMAMHAAKPITPVIKPTVEWPDLKPKVEPRVEWPELKPKTAAQDVMVRQRFMTVGALEDRNGGVMTRQRAESQQQADDAPRLQPIPRVITPRGPEGPAKDDLVTAMQELTEAMRGGSASEVTIRDESGRAEVTRAPKGGKARLRVQKSGAF